MGVFKNLYATLTRRVTVNNSIADGYTYNQINRSDVLLANHNPYFRLHMRLLSAQQDRENSYYTGILNTISEYTVGSFPMMLGNAPINSVNDEIEDAWGTWCLLNGVGQSIRQARRGAARCGLGILIPINKQNTIHPIKLGFKTITALDLKTPLDARIEDRIYDGIEYDNNWDIVKIHTSDGKEYQNMTECILWFKETEEGQPTPSPECSAGLCILPSVKRIMDSIIKGKEFRSSMPLAIELDPLVYGQEYASKNGVPQGTYKYDPGTVPTLPPGTKLAGIPIGTTSQEDGKFLEMMAGAAARCINMPVNLVIGNSSDFNMASGQIDLQPWKTKVNIDRNDFATVPYQVLNFYLKIAKDTAGYYSYQTRRILDAGKFQSRWTYDNVFNHPDPQKNANARAVDLSSGCSTLFAIYSEQGKNPRRELEREAQLIGITVQELCYLILAKRTPDTLTIVKELQDTMNDNTE